MSAEHRHLTAIDRPRDGTRAVARAARAFGPLWRRKYGARSDAATGFGARSISAPPVPEAYTDRLTRSVAFLSRLLEAGVDVRFADLPAIERATGRFLLQHRVAVAVAAAGGARVAWHERGMRSTLTRRCPVVRFASDPVPEASLLEKRTSDSPDLPRGS
jgi:hypothetical protein